MFDVYIITNLTNNMQYVGMTRQGMADRWSKHKTRTSTTPLSKIIHAVGAENFKIELLEQHSDLISAMIAELENMRKYGTLAPAGYNALYTDDSCNKIREKNKRPKSEQEKKSISLGLTGLKQSTETVEKRVEKVRKPIRDQHGVVYSSIGEAVALTGIPACTISHTLTGRVRNPKHGFKFTYCERT